MPLPKRLTFPAVSLLLALPTLSQAEIQWSGFGSIVGGITSEDHDFRTVDYSKDVNFKPDSKLALQAYAPLDEDERLSLTVQILAKSAENYEPKFEWAYINYEITNNTTVQMGSLRIPFYKYSDYLDVGYAYPFAKPPRAMYSLLFSSYDGLSFLYNRALGSWDFSSKFIFGNNEDTFFTTSEPTVGQLDNFVGGNLNFTRDWLSLYFAYLQADLTIPRGSLEAGADQMIAAGATPEAASRLTIDGDQGTFTGIGVSIDYENFIFNAEAAVTDVEESIIHETEQWYVNVGYRFGQFLPYIIYEETSTNEDTETASYFPDFLQASVQAQFLDPQMSEYNAISLGLRYDLDATAALKFQYTSYDDIIASNTTSDNVDQLTVGIDFVF